jgi:hypothetical protein
MNAIMEVLKIRKKDDLDYFELQLSETGEVVFIGYIEEILQFINLSE